MPTFDTPGPISTTVDLVVGDVRISVGRQDAAVVEVTPSDASNDKDRKAAEQTRVEYANGQLVVRGPRSRSWFSMGGSIDVTIELPADSQVHGAGGSVDFRCDGTLGDCWIKTGLGHIRLDRAATVSLKSGAGDISVSRAVGEAFVQSGSGEIRLRELDGNAMIKNSNGDTWVGVANAEVRIKAANGDIVVDLARSSVDAMSANGDVRLGEVVRGSVVLETQIGDLDVGIRENTAAWLDVSATAGRVHNELVATDTPEKSTETVEVRARTSVGNVVIRRPR